MKTLYVVYDEEESTPRPLLAKDVKDALKIHYLMKGLSYEVEEILRGKVMNTSTKEYFTYKIKVFTDKTSIIHVEHYEDKHDYDKKKLESDVVYIKDAWIPKTIMSEVKYASDESIYARISAFSKESIFLMLVNGGLVRRCAYNPFTQCLIVSRYVINNDTFYNVIDDAGENPIEDFVFFDLGAKDEFSSGYIHFKLFDVKNMKHKDESYKIVKTLEMLKNNGIIDETKIIFPGLKRKINRYSYKYFMKVKVMW